MAMYIRFVSIKAVCAFSLCVAFAVKAQDAEHRTSAPGIAFAIGGGRDGGPVVGVFDGFAGAVEFAAGRGRLDILSKSSRADVSVGGSRIATPLGEPGDYYLFDSTGFLLVRPAKKTFSSFALSDASYNYEDRRDDWPVPFEFSRLHPDTLGNAGASRVRVAAPGKIYIFWHVDDQRTRGRLTIVDAPPSEIGVARWFGASEALANTPTGTRGSERRSVLLTAVVRLAIPEIPSANINLIATHETLAQERREVLVSRLVLPVDFKETSWLEPDVPSSSSVSQERAARWRSLPTAQR